MTVTHGPDDLSLVWDLPFAGLLLSIAIFPLFARHWWERYFWAVTAAWALALHRASSRCRAVSPRPPIALLDTAAHDYVPFILLLFALFVVAGGIRIAGNLGAHRSPTS